MERFHHVDRSQLDKLDALQQAEAKELLKALDELREHDPLQFFKPHAKQIDFMATDAPIKAFLGGNRSGKTTVGIVDDLIQACDRKAVPEHLHFAKVWEPPFYCRIITPDFTATMEGVVFQKLREWAPRAQLVGGSWVKAYDKPNRMLRFKNGSWFQFMTYEQDLDKFGGAALHRVHYDEEPPESIRKECLMRLIDYGGQEAFTMTPLMGMSWMYSDIWEPWEKGTLRDAHVVTVDMDDNPYLDNRTKERVLQGLNREERQARKQGRFVHFGGMIYPDFDRERHVVPELPRPRREDKPFDGSSIWVGIDPGQRNMAAAVYCAIADEEGTLLVFDEVALQGATVKDMCAELHARNEFWKISPRAFVIDPVARNHVHQTGRSDQMEYADHGIATVLGQNSVTAGISNVRTRLQNDALLICANCEVLLDEFRKYRWTSPKKVSDDDPAERPIKKDDHLLDALRYVCMARPYMAKSQPLEPNLPLHERLVRDQLNNRPDWRRHVGISHGGPGAFA